MTWRLAKSLETLRAQINAAYPRRLKSSDGTIGDAAHASRNSDHNPWVKDGATGVVTALDITHDPANGVDIQKLADALVASRDSRIKYIVANGRIVSGTGQGNTAWQWRAYSGANKHTKHIHISVKPEKVAYDSTTPWQAVGSASVLPFQPAPLKPADSVLKKGSKGPFVTDLQNNLNAQGYSVGAADGIYGAKTEAAVKAFQQKAGLAVDGWAGPRTIEAIGKATAERAAKPKIVAAAETVKHEAAQEVEKKTGRLQWVTGLIGSGGLGLGWLAGMNWDAIVAGGAVLIVMLLIFLLLRRQIVSAVKDIREGLA